MLVMMAFGISHCLPFFFTARKIITYRHIREGVLLWRPASTYVVV